jgi:hypothetical protein
MFIWNPINTVPKAPSREGISLLAKLVLLFIILHSGIL